MQLASQQRQQPFFKTNTSSTTTSGSYFLNYNTSTNKNGNQNHFSQSPTTPRSSSASVMNFFPPNNTVSRQKDKESERETTQTTERLSALHNKLHQEAEKIRKWKTKTDLELNDKTKKLQDANQTIESQRKSILELQLQNEKLSSKLQEELAGHAELEHKTIATRELCNVLKDQVFRIDEAVSAGEQDREELHFAEKQRLEQFQELVVKFQELEIQHSTKYNEMKDKLQKQHEKHGACIAETTQCIQEKDKQILILSEEKAEKDNKISALVQDLGENREHLEVTKKEEAALKDKLKKSESIITSQDVHLKSVGEMLTYTQNENKELMSQSCERERAFAELQEEKVKLEHVLKEEEKRHQLNTENFQANVRNLQNEVGLHKTRIEELTNNVNALMSKLDNEKDNADIRKTENEKLQNEIDTLKASNEKLIGYQEELMNSLQELDAEKTSLLEKTNNLTDREKALKVTEESCKAYITELESKKEQLEQEIESNLERLLEKGGLVDDLNKDLAESKIKENKFQEQIEKLEELLRKESVNQDSISSDLQKIEGEKGKMSKEIEQANKEIKTMSQQVKALQKVETELRKDIAKASEQQQNLEAEVVRLTEELQEKEGKIDETLDLEKNTIKTLRQELTSKEKELSSLENKTKTMQNQITSKSKQVKDLQQEIKTMKSSATTQTKKVKLLEKKNETLEMEAEERKTEKKGLEMEIEMLKKQIDELREKSAKETNELEKLNLEMDKGVKNANTLKAEVKKLKDVAEKALKEKNECQARFEKERAELCTTLENYKAENERIVAQKERDLEKFKQNKEIEIEAQAKKIKDLEQKVDNLNKSNIEAENAKNQVIVDKDVEINILKQKLLDKEQDASENVQLRNVLETPTRMQIVPSTPKTPRSILKQSDQPSKKRRVAFCNGKSTSYSSDEDDKAFKVFKINQKKSGKNNSGSAIPTKVVRPNVRHSPGPNKVAVLSKASSAKSKKMNEQKGGINEEMEQFKELFPDLPTDLPYKKDNKDAGKDKKTSFKSRITQISPRKNETEIDWFDNDAFFGFDG